MLWLTPCWTKDSCRSVANCLNERRVAFRQLFLIFALKNRPLGGFFFWSEWLDSNLLSRRKFRARTALNNNASVTRFLNFSATPYAVWKSRQNFAFCGKNSRSNGCFCPQASSRSLVLLQKKTAHWAVFLIWSEWLDLNQRPLRPERSVLPGWTTLR